MNNSDQLILLKPGNFYTPLVFIHPIGGSLLVYKSIVDKLEIESAIYGIKDNIIGESYVTYLSIYDQAKVYLEFIFDKLCCHRISFAGLSSGGYLSFIMAHLCLGLGLEATNVIMFDSWVKVPFDYTFKNYFQKIILRQLDKLELVGFPGLVQEKDEWLIRIWQRMNLFFDELNLQYTDVIVTYFKASDVVGEYKVDASSYAWQPLVRAFNCYATPGNHETILEDGLEVIFNKINEVFLTRV
jgi:hypothetical protein